MLLTVITRVPTADPGHFAMTAVSTPCVRVSSTERRRRAHAQTASVRGSAQESELAGFPTHLVCRTDTKCYRWRTPYGACVTGELSGINQERLQDWYTSLKGLPDVRQHDCGAPIAHERIAIDRLPNPQCCGRPNSISPILRHRQPVGCRECEEHLGPSDWHRDLVRSRRSTADGRSSRVIAISASRGA